MDQADLTVKQTRSSTANDSKGKQDPHWYSVRIGKSVRDRITKYVQTSEDIGSFDYEAVEGYELALKATIAHLGDTDDKYLTLLEPYFAMAPQKMDSIRAHLHTEIMATFEEAVDFFNPIRGTDGSFGKKSSAKVQQVTPSGDG